MIEIEQENLLIVEGNEEKLFFDEFIKYLKLENIQTMPIGGKTFLQPNLKALVRSPGFSNVKSIGIVRDADGDHDAAFQSVCGALNSNNLSKPDSPLNQKGNNPKINIFIMPGINLTGMLEDLCIKSVQHDCAIPCVEDFINCLERKKCPLPRNLSKAKVQVFLASRKKAGLRLGEAAKAGYWPWEDESFNQIKDFIFQVVS